MAEFSSRAALRLALAEARVRPAPPAEQTSEAAEAYKAEVAKEEARFQAAVDSAWIAALRRFAQVYHDQGEATDHFPKGEWSQDEPRGVWRVCPSSGSFWFEPDDRACSFCAECGAKLRG